MRTSVTVKDLEKISLLTFMHVHHVTTYQSIKAIVAFHVYAERLHEAFLGSLCSIQVQLYKPPQMTHGGLELSP